MINAVTIHWDRLALEVEEEVQRARKLFPEGDNPTLHALHEEVGELTKAILQLREGRGSYDEARVELVQVMAMCVRLAEEGDRTLALAPLAADGREVPGPKPCRECAGEGWVANSTDREPWSHWAKLPPGSDFAVRMGIVQPVACPTCNPNRLNPPAGARLA
ncbi:MAG: MazG-like family protein [Myxococcota bacterium]